jgi:galactofuranosylgalactofuranosylrhamnosyl-N-acetylglucosaminyl-diphospho-decaprenol beta-1,5/1,6-galactofuranosyltransferase
MTAHRIQDVIGPDFGRPARLYVARGRAAQGPLPWSLAPGDAVDLNTYFNAFFPDAWARHTAIGQVGVQVETEGAVRVEIGTIDNAGDWHTRLAREVDGSETLWVDTPGIGRLAMRLSASEAATVHDLAWVTEAAPVQAPTLTIGLCTFNREDQLAVTLDALARLQDRLPAIAHIYVVNQGATFTNPAIRDIAARDGVSVIEQTNLGGCGGFTRTMIEATERTVPATYHLLMDDDIILDPRVVDRALRFLAYATDEIALGGQMIDLDAPTRLREFGAKLNPTRYVEPIGENLDLTDDVQLSLFHAMPRIDYNAWWFCVIPTATIRRIGPPVPIFIRGDDIEYGCRMARAGVETISLPGVAVWHESFQHKTSDWLEYYNMRNRLFVATLYPELVWRPAAYYLFGYILVFLFQHRFRTAEMVILAMQDVLSGVDTALGEDAEARHVALMARQKDYPDYIELAPGDLPETIPGDPEPLDTSVPAMVVLSVWSVIGVHWNAIARLWRKPLQFPYVPMPNNIGARDYVAPKTPEAERYVYYRTRIWPVWSIMARGLWVSLRYGLTPKARFRKTAETLEARRDPALWRRMFALPRGRF